MTLPSTASLRRPNRAGEAVFDDDVNIRYGPVMDEVNPEATMLIDGELVAACSAPTFANINPATEDLLGEVSDGSAEELHRAIDAGLQLDVALELKSLAWPKD